MLKIRKAEPTDIKLLYNWVNDSAVRENSFNSNHISYEEHEKWFSKIMADENVYQYILMDNGLAVGQIRLNIDGNIAEIGYSIAKEFRGKGYGKMLLQLIVEEVEKNLPHVNSLVAKVKPNNISSKKSFESAGFITKYLYYELKGSF